MTLLRAILLLSIAVSVVLAQQCASTRSFTQTVASGARTQFSLSYPSNVAVIVTYVLSTSGNVEATIEGCSSTFQDNTLAAMQFTLANIGTNTSLAVQSGQLALTTAQSAAPRVGASYVSLLAAIAACVLVFPKNRLSVAVLLAVLSLALFAPTITAQSAITLNIRIALPPQYTSCCENGACQPSELPTAAPTAAPTATPTTAPTVPPFKPASIFFNLRILILAPSYTADSLNVAQMAFDSLGTPYDVIYGSADLAARLDTTSTLPGAYSGIVKIGNSLTATQNSQVSAYMVKYNVKMVVLNSAPSAITGVTALSTIYNGYEITLSPAVSKYTAALRPNVALSSDYKILWFTSSGNPTVVPVTITDSSLVTPALLINGAGAGAVIYNAPDGTQQLHYFMQQDTDYLFARIFLPLLQNFISPAGVFIGRRRITLSVQADDLFLGTWMWNTTTHSNPLNITTSTYRMTADDMQFHHDYYTALNNKLPIGSFVTVEWPFNGDGVYTGDLLFAKTKELQSSFWFLSHTWSHPCDLDTATKAQMTTELTKNIQFTPSLLTGGITSPYFSPTSLINPCISGLRNGNVLSAMQEQGITKCVGDNTVPAYQTPYPYHALWSNATFNGYAGIFIVPRQALAICYDCAFGYQMEDSYNTRYNATLTFEEIMAQQVLIAIADKSAWRQDPYMMHQANGASYMYDDPMTGTTHTISLITIWTDRVVNELMKYYTLPVVTPKMDDIAALWLQRLDMDNCGATVTVGTNTDKQLVSVSVSSTKTCSVAVSGVTLAAGAGIVTEVSGPEKTTFVDTSISLPRTFGLSTPLSL